MRLSDYERFGTVSIRAPRTGRKHTSLRRPSSPCGFNPRPAYGAKASPFSSSLSLLKQFQSAPRVRGESEFDHLRLELQLVSIRAPRTGRKLRRCAKLFGASDLFQSAPRVRGESRSGREQQRCRWFQSAPRVRGESEDGHHYCKWCVCFNPRPAYGAKEPYRRKFRMFVKFQSAPRVRGERYGSEAWMRPERRFQSAPRVRGERLKLARVLHNGDRFQSAPRVRGESVFSARARLCTSFQSAPRVRGESSAAATSRK